MNKIPIAKEFCNEKLGFEEYGTDVPYFMIEFAKLHLEAAIEAVINQATTIEINDDGYNVVGIDDESILNAYPLKNIK